jgi:hypothetical protein
MAVELEDLFDATLVRSGTTFGRAALTGDATASAGSNAVTIASDAVTTAKILDANVTLAKMANLAESTVIGRAAGAGAGVPTALTATQATAVLNNVVGDSGAGGTKGLAPAPSAGDAAANKFLHADGTYKAVAGAGGAPSNSQYVTLATDANLSAERVLTGTANQITVTDGGAGSTVTLATPQDIATSSTPQFGRLGLGAAADASAALKVSGQFYVALYDAGNSGAALTLNWNNGNEQLVTLTGNVTFTLSNPKDGGRYVIVLLQDGTGGRTVTWPAAVKWPAGSTPTITATASRYDLVTLIYLSGAGIYLASINQNYSA